ncbi:MAG: class I mannose-6-phosphate isomerase [Prevotella sp.]|nr:class I mannose-6-phosphate isomerase [Prevotella sp.]
MATIYKFNPILKQTLWGGSKIISFKQLDTQLENVGESWEISGVTGNETVVADGPDRGKTLTQLLREQKAGLVGKENYERFGDEFPLLIKFIDARRDLSIQVHPTDEMARRQGQLHGKTEMWYALPSDAAANPHASEQKSGSKPMLYNGLKHQITPAMYKQMVANGTITEALARHEVSEGDVFFIPAGRIHAIGAGCFVAEIQQTSDTTYRIYDFNRRDKDGNFRELHTELAAESIDYSILSDYRTHYQQIKNEGVPLVSCPYFTTAVYDLTEPMSIDYSELDSFVILIAVSGEGTLSANGQHASFRAGEVVLLPATVSEVKVEGIVKFLETYT